MLIFLIACDTGMTDPMRENYKLMSCVAQYTRLNPRNRVQKLLSFNKRLQDTPAIVKEFSEWNLELDHKLLDIPGRLLNNEVLTFGGNATVTANKGDWSREMQNKRCLFSKPLKDWVLIVTERDKGNVQVLYIFIQLDTTVYFSVIYISAWFFIRKKCN